MNNKIAIIAGVRHHNEVLAEVMREMKREYTIYHIPTMLDTDSLINTARYLRAEGTEIIISGPTMAKIIINHVDIPVVSIKRSSISFAKSIRNVQKTGSKCAIVGPVGAFTAAAQRSRELIEEDIPIYAYGDEQEIHTILTKCIASGIETVISSSNFVENTIKATNLGYVSVPFDKDDVKHAFNEAEALLFAIEERMKNDLTLNLIQNIVSEGIIVLAPTGEVLDINQAGQNALGITSSIIGNNIVNNFPILVATSDGSSVLDKRQNDIVKIGDKIYSLSTNHITIHDVLVSIVLTFRPIEQIQKAEQEIRKKLHTKGNIATHNFDDIVGTDPVTLQTISVAKRFAVVDSTILIYGPSGSGKEIFAQSIHNASPRREGPFVVVNCAALPESLLESILFGYEKGAFTGASANGKKGLFELAHGGTVFLDEIGEMPLNIQTRFLRVLQEHEITPIGGSNVIPIDVRVICATNRDLTEMIGQKAFREDLYYRISVLILNIPALCERKDDIAILAKYFILKKSEEMNITVHSISQEAIQLLTQMDFPGNIRQLNNFIERILVLNTDGKITPQLIDLATNHGRKINMVKAVTAEEPSGSASKTPVEEAERKMIVEAIRQCERNKKQTAVYLKISYPTLWRKMKRLNISWNED